MKTNSNINSKECIVPKCDLILGDCVQVMSNMKNESIDLVVTSPPYDNRRDYGKHEFNFKEIARQLFRVTKLGGVVVWVVGDKTENGSESGTSFEQALFFKELGFNLHDTMIYAKNSYPPNCMSVRRYAQIFEYMFVFTKGSPSTFNPIMRKTKLGGKERGVHSRVQVNGERKKYGKNASKKYHNETIERNVWLFNTGNATGDDVIAFEHPAPFPEGLAKNHILSWSNEGDVVLDPMMGSGTTCKVARELKRNSIGIEIHEPYYDIAKKRCESVQEVLTA